MADKRKAAVAIALAGVLTGAGLISLASTKATTEMMHPVLENPVKERVTSEVLHVPAEKAGDKITHEDEYMEDHVWIAENSQYDLYMREKDLSLIIKDKQTGAYLESAIGYDDEKSNKIWFGAMQSAVVLTYINNQDESKQADLINDKVKKTIRYSEAGDGFVADLYWEKYKFGFSLDVTFDDNGLVCTIPEDSIKEESPTYMIGTVAIYPYMGTSYLDDKEGYMFIPDGNGALIYLDDKEGRYGSGYSAMIYGSDIGFRDSVVSNLLWEKYDMVVDSEQIIAPVFGIAHTDDKMSFLGIVEEGAERAYIEAHPNGASVDYNRAYARFLLRRTYMQPTSNTSSSGSFQMTEADRTHSNLTVRFLFQRGEEANYAGMANAYRNYLLDRGELNTGLDNAYHSRVDFMGTDREKWVIGTKPVTMTTTSDIAEIYSDLASASVTNLLSVYKGWQKGGIFDLPITSYSADKEIGGTGSLTKLIKKAASEGNTLYLYNDAKTINPEEKNASFNVVKLVNKRRYSYETYKDVYEKMMVLTPQRSAKLLEGFVKSYTRKGINNLAVAGITNTVFSYSYSGSIYARRETAASYETTLDTIAAKTNLIMEQPFMYLWHDTKAFLDMPLYTSNYIFEDESVPFLSIVLKGVMPVYSEYINFEANKKEYFLKMVETGTYPSFYITKESSANLIYTNSSDIYSSEYSTYKDTIVSYDAQLKALNEKVAGATITKHERLTNGVTKITYSNGVKVYVNYGSQDQTTDGVTVKSMSYEVTT